MFKIIRKERERVRVSYGRLIVDMVEREAARNELWIALALSAPDKRT